MTTSIARLQLALNSEDQRLVTSELQTLRSTILEEHDAVDAYGYHGRCAVPLCPAHPKEVVGILKAYLQRSPKLEELFSVWDIANKHENRVLLAAIAETIAVILFCAASNPAVCAPITQRIFREQIKAMHSHLASGHTNLVHCMLGLLLAIARVSEQSSRDLYQKLILSSQCFNDITQRGKRIKSEAGGIPVETDSRSLLLIVLATILLKSNEVIAAELLTRGSVLRRSLCCINNYSLAEVKMILDSIKYIIQNSSLPSTIRLNVLDSLLLERILLLYHGDDEINEAAHDFMLSFCHSLASELKSKRELAGLASMVISKLTPYSIVRQKDVILSNILKHSITNLLVCRCASSNDALALNQMHS